MKISNGVNFEYDDTNPDCKCILRYSQGETYAYIQCLDIGMPHCRHEKPILKRYWGKFDSNEPEFSIAEIMRTGGKWNNLPE